MPHARAAPPLRAVYLYLSGSCNLNCRHCWVDPAFVRGGRTAVDVLSFGNVEKVVTEALPLGLREVKLTGGEPMMHPDFARILSLLRDRKLDVQLETNGTLVDRESARAIASPGGRMQAAVSIDGPTPGTHDGFRGVPGAFRDAVRGIGLLADEGLRPQMMVTLHRGNLTRIGELIGLAERLGCGSVKFGLVIGSGRASGPGRDLSLTVPEVLEADRILESELIPAASIPVMLGLPMAFFSPTRLLRTEAVKCSVLNILGVLPGGEAALCGIGMSVPDLVFGNTAETSVESIWNDSPGLALLRRTVPGRLEGVCTGCLHRNVCQGFCIAMNYLESGSLGAECRFCREADSLGLFPETRRS
jgi:SynChlorMet cassette radical SAM/SPASM protein ScmF